MAGEEIYIARLGAWIARALSDTSGFAGDLDTDSLGFQMPDAIATHPAIAGAGTALADAGTRLSEAASELEGAIVSGDNGDLVKALLHLVEGVYRYVESLTGLIEHIGSQAAALPSAERNAVQAFSGTMARKAIDYMVITLLEQQLPRTAFVLKAIGLIDWTRVEASGGVNEPAFVRKGLRLERIRDLLSDPAAHFANVYGWGTASFDPTEIFSTYLAFHIEESSIETGKIGPDAYLRYGPLTLRRDSASAPAGLLLDYTAKIEASVDTRVKLSDDWGIGGTANLALEGGALFRLKPPFEASIEPKTGTATGALSLKFDRNPGKTGFTIVGGNGLFELTAENFALGGDLTVGASTTGAVSIDPGVFADISALTLRLGSDDADNFLASLLASANIEGVFDLGLGWSLSKGLRIRAAGGLEIAIPMHQSLGVATLETLYLILKIRDDGSFGLELSTAITGNLGPLTASVERMGVEVRLAFSNQADAPLGPLDLSIGFKPPNGVGLAIDAGIVRGGGYLYLDFEKGEYAGALELVFSGFLAVKAIGLINTKMPDGSDGFSLLIVITAEFGVPFQLGFGFTLIGLGGLLGLNRTMMLEELAEGVRTGAVESVMFPQDVIANAPKIISDMKRFFPPKAGNFLIGPMAKLGWGTPTLVSASLGVIVEVPPGNVAILGVLKCVLPDEDAALLVLQVKFVGALEVDKKRLWFFASLFGSRVLWITIGGEMGLLIAWGDNADFVLSVGGFHPKFNPPPLPFPSPQRVCFSILDTPYARIRVESYFAVTSNTVQFGSRAELFFGLSDFSIEGHLGYDALFQFSPFYFIITFSASMGVKVFGIGLFSVRIRGELEGPTPWHVEGEGSISCLFFDIDVPFSHTWGDNADTMLPSIAVMPLLKAEFEKRENWTALAPAGVPLSVSLRAIEATEELVLHPVGALRISQRAVPLNIAIEKVGNKPISDVEKVTLHPGGSGLVEKAKPREPFALAQFRKLDGAAKLSAPGYEKMDAGSDISVAGNDTRTSHAVKRIVLHELIVIDSNYKEHVRRFFKVTLGWFTTLLSSNATARSQLSKAAKAAKVPFVDKVKANEPGFVIAQRKDNSMATGTTRFATHAEAVDALRAQGRVDAKIANDLHIIPSAEMRSAA